jgi:hypothetical protein
MASTLIREPLVDLDRKRLYPPKPKRSVGPRRMTIGIGLLPIQGKKVLLATDTQYTSAVAKYTGEKVFPLPPRDRFRLVVAASGNDANLMGMAAQSIDKCVPYTSQPLPMQEICSRLESQAASFHKAHVLPLVKAGVISYDDPQYSFLIAAWCSPDQVKLFKSYKGIVCAADKYDFIGSGEVVVRAYESLGDCRTDEFEAGLLAIYWARRAKRADPYCAGDTSLYVLDEDGSLRHALPIYVGCAERHFDEVEKLFNLILIPRSLGDEDMLEEVLDQNLRGEVSEIRHHRRDLLMMYDQNACYQQIWAPAPT